MCNTFIAIIILTGSCGDNYTCTRIHAYICGGVRIYFYFCECVRMYTSVFGVNNYIYMYTSYRMRKEATFKRSIMLYQDKLYQSGKVISGVA